MGAVTPGLRVATVGDMENLNVGIDALGAEFDTVKERFRSTAPKFKHKLVMEFARGSTIKKLSETDPLKLIAALRDPALQSSLGRILAADSFAGNPDRAMAVTGWDKTLSGWYHEQNLIIDESDAGFTAVAIDNAFRPWLMPGVQPYGRYMGNIGLQSASAAAASRPHFATELGLIFDRLVEELAKKIGQDALMVGALKELKSERANFVARAGESAEAVMAKLLESGQHWKVGFSQSGADKKVLMEFAERKRFMRLIRAGVDPEAAREIAAAKSSYAGWREEQTQTGTHS